MHPTKEHILNTALDLFTKQGFEKTPISLIISKTKLSKGAVYHHFTSKEEIASTAIDSFMQEVQSLCEEIVAKDINALKKFQEIITAQERLMKGKEKALIEILSSSSDLIIRHKVHLANEKYFFPLMTRIIEQGKREGIFKIDDALITTYIIAGIKESFFLLPNHIINNKKQLNTYIMEVTSVIEKALGTKKGSLDMNFNIK